MRTIIFTLMAVLLVGGLAAHGEQTVPAATAEASLNSSACKDLPALAERFSTDVDVLVASVIEPKGGRMPASDMVKSDIKKSILEARKTLCECRKFSEYKEVSEEVTEDIEDFLNAQGMKDSRKILACKDTPVS